MVQISGNTKRQNMFNHKNSGSSMNKKRGFLQVNTGTVLKKKNLIRIHQAETTAIKIIGIRILVFCVLT